MTARVVEGGGARGGAPRAVLAYLHVFAELPPNARLLLVGNLCVNIGLGVFAVLFNLYLVALGHSLGYVGLVAAATTVGQAAIALLVGLALRRVGERGVLMAGAAGMALTATLLALVTNDGLLVVASVLFGAAFSTATIPALPYMMRYATEGQRTHLFSAYFASSTMGAMLGSLLSGAVPALVVAILHTNPRVIVPGDRAGLVVGVLAMAAGVAWFRAMRAVDAPIDHGERPARPVDAERDERRTRRDVLVMLLATTLIALTMGATMPFFNVYFATRLHAGAGTIGAVFAASGLVCAIVAFLAPALGRWGRLRGFNAARILTAPAFLIFWLHPGLGVASAAYVARNALGTVSGALENTYAMEILPARLRGIAAGWRSLAFNGGWSLGSLATGVIVARAGYDAVFVGAALLTLAGSAIYFGYFRIVDSR